MLIFEFIFLLSSVVVNTVRIYNVVLLFLQMQAVNNLFILFITIFSVNLCLLKYVCLCPN